MSVDFRYVDVYVIHDDDDDDEDEDGDDDDDDDDEDEDEEDEDEVEDEDDCKCGTTSGLDGTSLYNGILIGKSSSKEV